MGESTKNRFGARIIGIVTASNRYDPALWGALAECDAAEFRADGFEPSRISDEAFAFRRDCAERLGKPLETLLTLRLKRDGGAWPDAEASRRKQVWQSLGLAGKEPACDWIDVEMEEIDFLSPQVKSLFRPEGPKLLLSHHDFGKSRTRAELKVMVRKMHSHRPDGMKFALTCGDRAELEELLAFAGDLAKATPNGALLSMGREGRTSRVVAPMLGCPFTYGYLTGGAVAPGQLSARGLNAFFRGLTGNEAEGRTESELVDWAEARIEGEKLAD